MKKIVMLNCLRANSVCTGAACLQAFNAKTKTFARYGDEPLELVAFFRCNGCDAPQDLSLIHIFWSAGRSASSTSAARAASRRTE